MPDLTTPLLQTGYQGKTVLVTGHTGFKGSWLTLWLLELGAKVVGFSLDDGAEEGIFRLARLQEKIIHIQGDIRHRKKIQEACAKFQPEMVFHLAAQALVSESYEDPVTTFETNVLGTVNVLECVRTSPSMKAAVLVTSDKCYKNKEWVHGYRENDELGGSDPYSASKSSAEIVIHSYLESFFSADLHGARLASVRAGNVVGGGDWSGHRIIPDAIKALQKKQPIVIRNPHSLRPWQHVLEPLYGYLLLGALLQQNKKYCGAWNFGPSQKSLVSVQRMVELLIKQWGTGSWEISQNDGTRFKESRLLNLDSSKAHLLLGWHPVLDLPESLRLAAEWYQHYQKKNVHELCSEQIAAYLARRVDINDSWSSH